MPGVPKRYDMSSPHAKAVVDEIVHGTFMKQGTMVAFPACFPGTTVQIEADESRITALDAAGDGAVYGGTSGRAAHLFVGMFHGVTGMVMDMGVVEGADSCAAVCCGASKLLACVNGPAGGRIVARPLQPRPFDLIQEWSFRREPFHDLGEPVPGERIVHAVADSSRTRVVGTTEGHVFTVDVESGEIRVVGQVPGAGRLGVGPEGDVFGLDEGGSLWRCDASSGEIERGAVDLPDGAWDAVQLHWARDPKEGLLYTADGEGRLYSLGRDGFSGELGRTMLAPVGPMAVTLDGRVFGFCGAELSRLFCYDPASGEVDDVGVAVSVIERRRYGYVFGDAVVGRDGQIFFGENDDLGHLWIYFPRIR